MENMHDARLVVERIARTFETPAGPLAVLRDVSFSMAPGETLAVSGPSGSGKSTLLNIIGSLDRPSSGTVALGGECVTALPERRLPFFRARCVGFVFQDHHLLPQCTALENVMVPTIAAGAAGRGTGMDAGAALLGRVGLGNRLDAFPSELSGGERQRVAVARALVNRPRLLLADEPTGSLDAAAADAVGALLAEIARADGVMLVVATHNPALARRLDRRAALRDGALAEER